MNRKKDYKGIVAQDGYETAMLTKAADKQVKISKSAWEEMKNSPSVKREQAAAKRGARILARRKKVSVSKLQRKLSEQLNQLLNSKGDNKMIAKKSVKKSASKKATVAARQHKGLLKGLREQKLAPVVGGLLKPKVKGVRKREFLPYKSGSAIRAIFEKLQAGKPVEQKTLFNIDKENKPYAKAALNRLARHGLVCGKWNVKLNGTKVQLLKKKGFTIPAAKAS